jgi:hypothetical protein
MAWYPQGAPDMGHLRHMVLLFGDHWTPEQFRYYAAHLDPAGRPLDWLFDSFLLFVTNAPGGASFLADINRGTTMSGEGDFYAIPMPKPGDKQDYEALLHMHLKPGGLLDNLQTAVAQLKTELGDPAFKRNAVISLPYPGINQTMWGSLEEGGRCLNFGCVGQNLTRATADRLAATTWFVDQVTAAWNQERWPDLNLLGFYWPFETVYRSWEIDDHWLLKELHQYLRSAGKRFFWVPFYATYNIHLLDDYQNYYFDLAFMQPNHMFYVKTPGIKGPARAAEKRNAGFELEYFLELPGENTQVAGERHQRLRHYLDGGVHFGYMNAACAWFHGRNGIMEMHSHADPAERELYEEIYRFVKGTYVAKTPLDEMP